MFVTPNLKQFRVEVSANNVVHLIFDMPNRSMNVFSNTAIHDLKVFAAAVKESSALGVVVRSGKSSAFCAGADLGELGQAYGMIMAAPAAQRFDLAFNHFFPLSQAIRALETCGKPVAAAVAGLALGGGCELALGAHYRVATDAKETAFGLPESLVGLLPGAGGTQRLPRVVGLDVAMPVLLEGRRLSSAEAFSAGLVQDVVKPGEEVEAAERWVLSTRMTQQPWDIPGWVPRDLANLEADIALRRSVVLKQTLGHYPAPLAILDCIENGFGQPIDVALRTEMQIFSNLIQRPEPRDMIATMFVAKTDYERRQKKENLPLIIGALAEKISCLWLKEEDFEKKQALSAAGFSIPGMGAPAPDDGISRAGYWFESVPDDKRKLAVKEKLELIVEAAERHAGEAVGVASLIDYATVTKFGFPAYLGGPFALRNSRNLLKKAG